MTEWKGNFDPKTLGKHSPEPWEVVGHSGDVLDANEDTVVVGLKFIDTFFTESAKKEDVDRIVACVNALRGVEDPEAFVASVANAIKHMGLAEVRKDYLSCEQVIQCLREAASAAKCFPEYT